MTDAETETSNQNKRTHRASSRAASLPGRIGAEYSAIGRWRVLCRSFWRHHQYAWWALWLFLGPVQHVFGLFALWFDTVVHRNLRTMRLDRPVFVFAHPRSGTTFLQQRLHETGQTSMFQTWETWIPSLTERYIARPIIRILDKMLGGMLGGHEAGHVVRIHGIEEDEGLFLHRLDSEFATFMSPYLIADPDLAWFWHRLGRFNTVELRRTSRFYVNCLVRQVLKTGKPRAVAKSNPNIFRMLQLLELCPDARFIYIVRSPEESIQSYLSLHAYYVSKSLTPEQWLMYVRNKYRWSVDLYLEFERAKQKIPEDQLLVLSFKELTGNVTATMKKVIEFAQLEPRDGYWDAIRTLEKRQHSKHHSNTTLNALGLSLEEVRKELKSGYEEYNLR